MVGTARFELATYGTQNRRATRLRYAPTELSFSGRCLIWKAVFSVFHYDAHAQLAVCCGMAG